ncbi:conserved hypothetical protein [delta proteobacterium NaphS2]|nr:conserved hypothetical protein [delta proteobacterium NaphS2]
MDADWVKTPCELCLAAILHGWKPLPQGLPFQNENFWVKGFRLFSGTGWC